MNGMIEIECGVQGEPQIGEAESQSDPIEHEEILNEPDTEPSEVDLVEGGGEAPENGADENEDLPGVDPIKDDSRSEIGHGAEESVPNSVPVLPPGIEQEIGHLSGAYRCNNNHILGTLFAGTEGFAFVGTLFFFTSRFSFKWTNVSQVLHSDMGHIVIQVRDHVKEMSYTFANIQSAERVWASLSTLHAECVQGTPQKPSLVTSIRTSLRRQSSDPTSLRTYVESEVDDETAYVAAVTAASMDDLRLSMRSRRMSVAPPEEPASDLEEAWSLLHRNPKESYKENAFENQQIPCSLEIFYQLFLQDDAPHSISNFMIGDGDSNVVASNWKTGATLSSKSRTIEYTHPINAPLAPPNAKARKEQRYRRFLEQGISIETDTYVDDVPMTDCFYVTDRILVKANEDGTVSVSAYFDIRFIKSTMFRSIIANTTRSEFIKWFQNLLKMLLKEAIAVGQPAADSMEDQLAQPTLVEPPVETVLHFTPVPTSKKTEIGLIHIMAALLAMVLMLQLYILHRMNSIETMLFKINAQQADVCLLPKIVRNAVLNTQECEELITNFASK